MRLPSFAAAALVAGIASATASAAFFEFRFSGMVVMVEGVVDPPFDVVLTGDTFEYRAIVDTLSPTSAIPAFYGVGAGTHYQAVIAASLNAGAVSIPMGPLPAGFTGSTFVSNDSLGTDALGMFAHVEGMLQIGILLLDDDMLALNNEAIPTTLSPEWDPGQSIFFINFGADLLSGENRILGVITDASVTEVPAPGSAALIIAAGVFATRRRRR